MGTVRDLNHEFATSDKIAKAVAADPHTQRARDARREPPPGAPEAWAPVAKSATVSFDQVRSSVCAALREKYPPPAPADGGACAFGPWVEDIYDAVAIFSNEGKLWSIGYTFENGMASLTGEPVQVVRSYAPATAPVAPPGTPAAAADAPPAAADAPAAT